MVGILNTTDSIQNIDLDTLKIAVEESRSPLILTDSNLPDNPIVYSNKAFLDLTGYSLKEIIGHNCRFLQGEATDQEAVTKLRDAVAREEYVRLPIENYRKDGTPFWNDLVMSPIKDASGKTRYFMGMQLDITDRIMAERGMQEKARQLEESNRELEQFTYAASHDLQEPLRMISSYLQLIRKRYEDTLDDDGRTFLQFATEGADRMQDLIFDLLTLSRVSTTTDKFKTIDMAKAVEQARFNLKLPIEETGAEIIVHDLPKMKVDPVQMTQLFQNLIGNAMKYRDEKSAPRIIISSARDGDDYVFSVADNGIGIDKQYFDRIFMIFQRLHTRKEYSGTGVGLAICARIVERHNGKIWVESTKGTGSTFRFSLPIIKKGNT